MIGRTVRQAADKHLPEKLDAGKRARKIRDTVVGVWWALLSLVVVVFGGIVIFRGAHLIGLCLIVMAYFSGMYGANIISGELSRGAKKDALQSMGKLVGLLGKLKGNHESSPRGRRSADSQADPQASDYD